MRRNWVGFVFFCFFLFFFYPNLIVAAFEYFFPLKKKKKRLESLYSALQMPFVGDTKSSGATGWVFFISRCPFFYSSVLFLGLYCSFCVHIVHLLDNFFWLGYSPFTWQFLPTMVHWICIHIKKVTFKKNKWHKNKN